MKKNSKNANNCPCGQPFLYENCCEPYLKLTKMAPSPLVLMRSRYTAYVLENEAYLLATWHRTTRPEALNLANNPIKTKWIRLEILDSTQQTHTGTVSFVAYYKENGRLLKMAENSHFVFENQQSYYVCCVEEWQAKTNF
jgi:SEC-C motif-containing protein